MQKFFKCRDIPCIKRRICTSNVYSIIKRWSILTISRRKIVTVDKMKNARWKVNVKGDFKQRYYNHKKSFRNQKYANETYECIVDSVLGYSNISERCMLCLHENYETLNYADQEERLNRPAELVSKRQHVSKFLLSNYKSND